MRSVTFLTCIGPDALEVVDGLKFDDPNDVKDIDKVMKSMEDFCIGRTNETYERYTFNKRDQETGESIDTYLATLRSLA